MTSSIHAITTKPPTISLPEVFCEDFLNSAHAPIKDDLKRVEILLRTSLQSKVEGVPEMMAYLIESGGKRIRPIVTCLMARACGYHGNEHIPIACIAELLHTATLYHDDVIDEAKLRRGRQTANSLFGNKVMVLSGDLMLAHCFSMLMEGGYFHISQALSQTVREMVEGEILELKYEGNFETSLPEYMEMIQLKTASLFSWSTKAAAMTAGFSPIRCKSLASFGHKIGMAFQLVDDLMDFIGDQKTMGKTILQDVEEGKITMPLLLVLKHFPHIKNELIREFNQASWKDGNGIRKKELLFKIQNLILERDVILDSKRIVDEALSQARDILDLLPASVYRTGLISLLAYLSGRDR